MIEDGVMHSMGLLETIRSMAVSLILGSIEGIRLVYSPCTPCSIIECMTQADCSYVA